MGKLMRNGILYSGSTDSALHIKYDNTDSGLQSTNVKQALDEVAEMADFDKIPVDLLVSILRAGVYTEDQKENINALYMQATGETVVPIDDTLCIYSTDSVNQDESKLSIE